LHVKAIASVGSEIEGKTSLEDLPPNPSEYTDDIVTMGYRFFSVVVENIFVTQNQHRRKEFA
jgi:hypothetical protein